MIPPSEYFRNPQAIINIFGQRAYDALNQLLNPCCNDGGTAGVLMAVIYTGDDSTTAFSFPTTKTLAFVTLDGVVATPGTAYTVTGNVVNFIGGAPNSGTVIVIYYQ